jgi:hypothetical protein
MNVAEFFNNHVPRSILDVEIRSVHSFYFRVYLFVLIPHDIAFLSVRYDNIAILVVEGTASVV